MNELENGIQFSLTFPSTLLIYENKNCSHTCEEKKKGGGGLFFPLGTWIYCKNFTI